MDFTIAKDFTFTKYIIANFNNFTTFIFLHFPIPVDFKGYAFFETLLDFLMDRSEVLIDLIVLMDELEEFFSLLYSDCLLLELLDFTDLTLTLSWISSCLNKAGEAP